MLIFLKTIVNEMLCGNFSFAILLVGIAQLVVMIINLRTKKWNNCKQRNYQQKPDGNFGYQPTNKSTPPPPPTTGSNIISPKAIQK